MEKQLRDALNAATIYADADTYALVHLPPQATVVAAGILAESGEAFSALLVDKDEITLVLSEALLDAFDRRLPDKQVAPGYRLLTFDVELPHDLVGFLSVVSAALAEAGIPIMAYSAFNRDHLLIQATHFDSAVQVIHQLKARETDA